MKVTDVFTPNKLPSVTFIDDHLKDKAKYLRESLSSGPCVISLSGPSKSGKTVFIEKTIGKGRLLQVTGAGIDSPKKLWDRVFDLIGTPSKVTETTADAASATVGAKAGGSLPFLASAEASVTGTKGNTITRTEEHIPDHLILLIKELGNTEFIVFIDDFHYVAREVQKLISEEIKDAVGGGVTFICASVPYHSDDVLRGNADLRGRIFGIDFDYWDALELRKIADLGFKELKIKVTPAVLSALADEAAGSPQLMQSLCLNLCFEGEFYVSQEDISFVCDIATVRKICIRTALSADYSSTVSKMKEGPKTRGTNRTAHKVNDGSIRDVYPIILIAISANPPERTIRYAGLQTRITGVCPEGNPSGSSVTGACAHMSDIANDAENRVIIEWDVENEVLDIRDPYLLFFLRWGDWK
jgi:hypothetical protein